MPNKYQEQLDQIIARRNETEDDDPYTVIDDTTAIIRRALRHDDALFAQGLIDDAMDGVEKIEGRLLKAGFDPEITEFLRARIKKVRKWQRQGIF